MWFLGDFQVIFQAISQDSLLQVKAVDMTAMMVEMMEKELQTFNNIKEHRYFIKDNFLQRGWGDYKLIIFMQICKRWKFIHHFNPSSGGH